jgi:DNA replication and repair protein RecF
VWAERLQLRDFRLFTQAELGLGPGLNLFTGGNGAGKTSVLEALHVLAYGRSFRGAVRDGLIRRSATSLQVYCELREAGGALRRLGLERGGRDWHARIDGESPANLSELYRQIAVVCFEPGSHVLIAGGSEQRRRFLDWLLFHVEPAFLPSWRRYQRALKQRNVWLKASSPDSAALDAWDAELAEAGAELTSQRQAWLPRLETSVRSVASALLPELGRANLRFQRGWAAETPELLDALRLARGRDLALGHTSVGPHRADWQLGYEQLPDRETFSRGQEKLTALACLLAQAGTLAEARGEWPILCLDDLGSELDRAHLGRALDWLAESPAQLLLTGTEAPFGVERWTRPLHRFHVEQGCITPLL